LRPASSASASASSTAAPLGGLIEAVTALKGGDIAAITLRLSTAAIARLLPS